MITDALWLLSTKFLINYLSDFPVRKGRSLPYLLDEQSVENQRCYLIWMSHFVTLWLKNPLWSQFHWGNLPDPWKYAIQHHSFTRKRHSLVSRTYCQAHIREYYPHNVSKAIESSLSIPVLSIHSTIPPSACCGLNWIHTRVDAKCWHEGGILIPIRTTFNKHTFLSW